MKAAKEHEGTVPTRGSGNYASDEAKEIFWIFSFKTVRRIDVSEGTRFFHAL